MFCPSCGKENAQSFGYCNACGRALTPAPGAAPTPSAGASPAPAPYVAEPGKGKRTIGIVIVLVVAALAGGAAWAFTHRAQIGRMFNTETPEQLVGRLMREAAGVQPVHDSFFSDKEFDDGCREQFRKVIHLNQEYAARSNQLDVRETGKVGTSESIADPEYAAEGIKQIHASFDLDRELEQHLKEVVTGLRRTFEKTSWSASEREAALRGFDTGFTKAMEKRTPVIKAEQGYANAVDDLYKFASDHHAEIRLVSGHIQMQDPVLVFEFNSRINAYNARRDQFLRAKQEFDRFQSDVMNKTGMTPKDAGIQ